MSADDFIAADDRAYLYGDALFETVRVGPNGTVRWLEAHIERLQRSGEALGFRAASIEDAVAKLRELPQRNPGVWRVTVSRSGVDENEQKVPFGGSGAVSVRFREYQEPTRPNLGLGPGFYLPDDRLAEHKTTSYLRSIEVRRRAILQGFDDAIMTSASGLVGEASCANLIFVRQGRAVTSPIRGILPGVTRAGLLRLSKNVSQPIVVREISVDELQEVDEIVLLSAGVGVLAAASLQGRCLDDSWAQRAQKWLP